MFFPNRGRETKKVGHCSVAVTQPCLAHTVAIPGIAAKLKKSQKLNHIWSLKNDDRSGVCICQNPKYPWISHSQVHQLGTLVSLLGTTAAWFMSDSLAAGSLVDLQSGNVENHWVKATERKLKIRPATCDIRQGSGRFCPVRSILVFPSWTVSISHCLQWCAMNK